MTPETKTAIIYPDRVRPANLRFILGVLPQNFFATEKYGGVWKRISLLHGPDHPILHIGFMEMYASEFEKRSGKRLNMPALRLASIFHDVKRENDNHDMGHGKRAAKVLKEYAKNLYDITTIRLATKICRHHETSFEKLPNRIKKNPNLRFFMVCDMLALVRDKEDTRLKDNLPVMLRRILPEFTPVEIDSMIRFSHLIHSSQEALFLQNHDRFESAWKAGVSHGLFTTPQRLT